MRYLKRFYVALFFVLLVFLSLQIVCQADTIVMTDGAEVGGVLLREEEDKVIVTTEKGDEVIKRVDIVQIKYDIDEENTLKLAGYAEKSDPIKAFYLYEKVLRINPQSDRAARAMERLQQYVYKDSEGRALATNYERYQTPVGDNVGDKELLNQNAVETEKVQKSLGIILATKDFRQSGANTYYTKVKVVDVVNPSRGYDAGVRLGDYLVTIDGYPGGRMGLYDAVSLLAKKTSGEINLTVERIVEIFVRQDDSNLPLIESIGMSADVGQSGIYINKVREGSAAYNAGIREGDLIVSADYGSIKLASVDDLTKVIKNAMPGNANLIIRRKIVIR